MRGDVSLRVILGVLLIVAGGAVLLAGRLSIPFGRLPGDIAYRSKTFSIYFPLTSSVVISILLSLLFYAISRFRR